MLLVSIAYDVVAPLLLADVERLIETEFALSDLLWRVAVYASILVVSLGCSYVQSVVLQKTGQKIVSALREDAFTHIESLSHSQLSEIPVGKLVTRVTNDTGAISMMFTGMQMCIRDRCNDVCLIFVIEK